jgi:phenylalanyl-tRNA synthetase beta subunit
VEGNEAVEPFLLHLTRDVEEVKGEGVGGKVKSDGGGEAGEAKIVAFGIAGVDEEAGRALDAEEFQQILEEEGGEGGLAS